MRDDGHGGCGLQQQPVRLYVPQSNNCAISFGRGVDVRWQNGVNSVKKGGRQEPEEQQLLPGTISVVLWGRSKDVDEQQSPSKRVNDSPSSMAPDLTSASSLDENEKKRSAAEDDDAEATTQVCKKQRCDSPLVVSKREEDMEGDRYDDNRDNERGDDPPAEHPACELSAQQQPGGDNLSTYQEQKDGEDHDDDLDDLDDQDDERTAGYRVSAAISQHPTSSGEIPAAAKESGEEHDTQERGTTAMPSQLPGSGEGSRTCRHHDSFYCKSDGLAYVHMGACWHSFDVKEKTKDRWMLSPDVHTKVIEPPKIAVENVAYQRLSHSVSVPESPSDPVASHFKVCSHCKVSVHQVLWSDGAWQQPLGCCKKCNVAIHGSHDLVTEVNLDTPGRLVARDPPTFASAKATVESSPSADSPQAQHSAPGATLPSAGSTQPSAPVATSAACSPHPSTAVERSLSNSHEASEQKEEDRGAFAFGANSSMKQAGRSSPHHFLTSSLAAASRGPLDQGLSAARNSLASSQAAASSDPSSDPLDHELSAPRGTSTAASQATASSGTLAEESPPPQRSSTSSLPAVVSYSFDVAQLSTQRRCAPASYPAGSCSGSFNGVDSPPGRKALSRHLLSLIASYLRSKGGKARSNKIGCYLRDQPSSDGKGGCTALQELKHNFKSLTNFIESHSKTLQKVSLDSLDYVALVKGRSRPASVSKYLHGLIASFLRSKGGTAKSFSLGQHLNQTPPFSGGEKFSSALAELKETYQSLANFINNHTGPHLKIVGHGDYTVILQR